MVKRKSKVHIPSKTTSKSKKKPVHSYLEKNRYTRWQRENDERIYITGRLTDPTTLEPSFFLWCKEDGTRVYDLTQDDWQEQTGNDSERINEGEFSHAYENGVDEQPGVFLYFNNAWVLNLGIPQKDEIIEELCICISHESYTKLRQNLIDNPTPLPIGF